MKKTLFLLMSLFFVAAHGQSPASFSEKYYHFISQARVFREANNFRASAVSYDSAFSSAGGFALPQDFYDAACSWALAGEVDSSFARLLRAAKEGKWAQPEQTASDSDLVALHPDKRWKDILDRMKANRLLNEHKLDKALEDTLNAVYTADQSGRKSIDSLQHRFGMDSPQMDSLWRTIEKTDSANLVVVKEVLARRSWPGPDEVGGRASMAVFLVIQHSDSLTQATYLPVMQRAVQQGAARAEDLALLEDRVLTDQGKPQLYGSQVRTDSTGKASFFPIFDEINVDKRRASVGLGSLEEYGQYFGIDYHLPVPPKNISAETDPVKTVPAKTVPPKKPVTPGH